MPRPLHALSADLESALAALAEYPDGEVPPEAEAALAAFIDGLEVEQAAKLDDLAAAIRRYEGYAASAEEAAKAYKARAAADQKTADRIRRAVLDYLTRTGQPTARTATGLAVSVRASGGAAPVVVDDDVDPRSLPERFQLVRVDVSRAAVAKALAAGEDVPWARWGERGRRLVIG